MPLSGGADGESVDEPGTVVVCEGDWGSADCVTGADEVEVDGTLLVVGDRLSYRDRVHICSPYRPYRGRQDTRRI
ncbi:MAG: hypothetical protein IPM21_17315 [Acidobacteria bacterium]|nr:hypothetical protein [Acidobacteriota bacterium]